MMKVRWVNKTVLFFICSTVGISCGVKGPPEPPMPTEASLKKEQKEKDAEAQKKQKSP